MKSSLPFFSLARLTSGLLCALAIAIATSVPAQVHTFTTLAGTAGSPGAVDAVYSYALFNQPAGLAVDSTGNLYVPDQASHTIRKISTAGLVTTLAGSAGLSGSTDGTGTAARFNSPRGVAVDSTGIVYVADAGNHTIRKITSAGVVSTLAGSAGVSGTTDGTGTAARFNAPLGVAVDASGNVYVADSSNHTIRKITSAGVVTTLAGVPGVSGTDISNVIGARFTNPWGVAVDSAGNVYVTDTGVHAIRKISPAGAVSNLAGLSGNAGTTNGTGAAARFNTPVSVAVDGAGVVYVGELVSHTIRRIAVDGVTTTLAGTAGTSGSADGTGGAAQFKSPYGLAADAAGIVYVGDTGNHTIRRITSSGAVTTLAGTAGSTGSIDGTGTIGALARFNRPSGVAWDGAGTVYVADSNNNTVRKISSTGAVTTLAGLAGPSGAQDGPGASARFSGPSGVAVDGAGNAYIADSGNHTIRKITSAGAVSTLAGTAGSSGLANGTGSAARFKGPIGVAVDSIGNVYVADSGNHAIRKISSAGVVTTLAGTTGVPGFADGSGGTVLFRGPSRVAVDSAGNVYVADSGNQMIRKITSSGVVSTLAGSALKPGSADGSGAAARFFYPEGIAVDGAGNVYVADNANHTIRKITSAGVVSTLAGFPRVDGTEDGPGGAALFQYPRDVAVDSAGNLAVAESDAHVLRRITSTGVVTTLAGDVGNSGSVDGVARIVARFNTPYAAAVGRAQTGGNVFVADRNNHVVRAIALNASFGPNAEPAGRVSTLAGQAGTSGAVDGAGSTARFNLPAGVVADAVGGVYVADAGNHTIRKIAISVGFGTSATVSTLAGLASTPGSANGTGGEVRFNNPNGVAANNASVAADVVVYVADSGNHTIRRITSTGVVTTLAGLAGSTGSSNGTGGEARFNNPTGVAHDKPVSGRPASEESIYVADTGNHTIRKISSTGVVTTLAGLAGSPGSTNGTGTAARFNGPTGVAADEEGNVYVTDTGNHLIRKITPGGVVTTVGGTTNVPGSADGNGIAAQFSSPRGIAMDGESNLYLADAGNHTIRHGRLRLPPAIVAQPPTDVTARVGDKVTIEIDANGEPNPTYQWFKDGVPSTPPLEGATQDFTGFFSPKLEFFPVELTDAATYTVVVSNFVGSVTSTSVILRVNAVPGAPTITTQPVAQTVAPGGNATFSVVATGDPTLTYQWLKDGAAILGARSASLTLNAVTAGDAASYAVVVTNGVGSATSRSVALTVAAGGSGPPTITTQPIVQTVTAGGNVNLSVVATGSPPLSYQWSRNGVPLTGATNNNLTLIGVGASSAGTYSVVVSNASGSVTSSEAALTVTPTSALANLSVRTTMAAGQILTVGAVLSGGTKTILIRGAGPALNGFGLSGMVDPRLQLYTGGTLPLATNDDWPTSLAATFASVGAFPFLNGSRDAALAQSLNGSFTVQALGTGPGTLLVEAYDVAGGMSPRLVNLSARNQVGTGSDILIAGFVLSGTGTKQLLIRAIGPGLTGFGVIGALVDPILQVINSAGTLVAANDNWDATLAPVFAQVAAFPLVSNSRDAALLVTLPAGTSYTVQVSGVNNGTGEALIEVYEIF